MKVYVLSWSDWHEFQGILGVYSTEEKARAAAEAWKALSEHQKWLDEPSWEEWDLDGEVKP